MLTLTDESFCASDICDHEPFTYAPKNEYPPARLPFAHELDQS